MAVREGDELARLDRLEEEVRAMRATWHDALNVANQLEVAAKDFDAGLKDARRATRKIALLARRLAEVLASVALVSTDGWNQLLAVTAPISPLW